MMINTNFSIEKLDNRGISNYMFLTLDHYCNEVDYEIWREDDEDF